MKDRYFLDTNILVYSLDRRDLRKAAKANALVLEGLTSGEGVISFQVVQEFFNLALKRFEIQMSHVDRDDYLERVFRPMLKVHSSIGLYSEALRLHSLNNLSWYDALIVCAAREAGCGTLYSEDLQHGQQFGRTRVVNPFR